MLTACSPADGPSAAATPGSVAQTTSDAPGPEEDIDRFLLQQYPDAGDVDYALGWFDLDGDGTEEAILHLVGPFFCGTGGCTTHVLTPAGPRWRSVADISVSRTPVTVLQSESNGWRDLTVDFSGGGMPGGIALLKFDGESYPGNPTVPPADSAEGHGEIVIAQEPEMRTARAIASAKGASGS